MSGETEKAVSGWTVDTLFFHMREMQRMDDRFHVERDRRYSEVDIEKEKALKIKETADERALGLQAETQKYKDEKANELRSQIERERGSYATKDDLAAAVDRLEQIIKPLNEAVVGSRSSGLALNQAWGYLLAVAGIAVAVIAVLTR